jgi:hypothetical protein
MLISPKIKTETPYGKKEHQQMAEKLDSLCGEGYTCSHLNILLKELYALQKEHLTFNKKVCRKLNQRMSLYSDLFPCSEIFKNSIYIELYKSFRNYPLKNVIAFIENLPFMS